MHQKAKDRLSRAIMRAGTPERRDFYLDQYADCLLYATEWDATMWDLDDLERDTAEMRWQMDAMNGSMAELHERMHQ